MMVALGLCDVVQRCPTMPCYLFTYHAYGSWMPDRQEGFVRRGQGVLPPDDELASRYRTDARQSNVVFRSDVQRVLLDELLAACVHQECRGHYIATETTHVHALVSWTDERPWKRLRTGLKSSLTRCLNRKFRRRNWFSEGSSRRRVKDQSHFDRLVGEYLPSHRGWKWREGGEPFL